VKPAAALWAGLALAAAGAAQAAVTAPSLAACDAGHETVLVPSPSGRGQARAAWLDAHHLRWADVSAGDGPIRLLYSKTGQLSLFAGQPARGADAAAALAPAGALPRTPLTQRFSHIGPGVTLAVPVAQRARLREWHRGQMLLVQEDAQGRVLRSTSVQAAGALDALYAAAERVGDLGAAPRRHATTFKLWAPTAQRVALCLYARGSGQATSLQRMRRDAASGVWSLRVPRNLQGHYFAYTVDVFARGKGLVRNLVTDPYALSLTADSQRGFIADLNASTTKPPGWDAHSLSARPARRVQHPVDMVIYELHVRDFSASDATVRPEHRGKYLAFTNAASAGMQHLQRLADAGVTDVHFLPIFDLASVPERGCVTPSVPAAAPDSQAQQAAVMREAARDCFNWGYDPWHFTAPEGSFATDAADGVVRVRELRAMVQALHKLNLRVGMDMVYNHTTASGQHPKSVLDRIVPGYYHRLDAKGDVETSTCCDNTATEHAMMAKLMIDSAVVWARDYRIDSFRFDLMGHQPRAAMERLAAAVNRAVNKEGRRIDVIGEGWNFGEVKDGARFVQAAQRALNGSGIGTFSDRARDAARGSRFDQSVEDTVREPGWLHGSGDARHAALIRVGLAGTLRDGAAQADYGGQPAGYASQPGEVVNYVENHDNQTLFDNNVTKLPIDTPTDERARVQHLGAALVAFSQGIAYFHAGQEILRSKSLDRNSYDSGDWFNRLDWSLTDNGFGAGLPPVRDNDAHWPVMRPLLAGGAQIKPTREQIAWTRDAFLDVLRIRASTPLLRLRSADEIQRRLRFIDSADARVVAAHLDGNGLVGAGHREVVYAINAAAEPRSVSGDALRGKHFVLHPVHRVPGAADARAASATFDAAAGRIDIPPRTAVVFVLPPP
jgi:pullulanase/glycogen debranching enzyme